MSFTACPFCRSLTAVHVAQYHAPLPESDEPGPLCAYVECDRGHGGCGARGPFVVSGQDPPAEAYRLWNERVRQKPSIPERIVAEIIRCYPDEPSDRLGVQFERVIETNRQHGYELQTWQGLHTPFEVPVTPTEHVMHLQETIIAVFLKIPECP